MDENQNKLNLLLKKLETLIDRQESFSREVNEIRREIAQLQFDQKTGTGKDFSKPVGDFTQDDPQSEIVNIIQKRQEDARDQKPAMQRKPWQFRTDLEKFIGENLINKIGIAITVIGVAIGAKYSIEHELISPLTRIILGYLAGLALLGVGIKLKTDYQNYSAVLVSGAMTIMYFITFAGYSFYELMPVSMAFALMVIFTIFTVIAALSYNNQVIALIGLVGAYAVPFLLSSESGNVKVLFSYMAIINIGILVIAFKKYWKLLYYAAFLVSWIIYLFWFTADFEINLHFQLAFIFAGIFFTIFYTTFLAYKLLKKEAFVKDDILLLLLNSFVFYGIGYAILDQHEVGEQLLGLFTVGNALIHFVVSIIVSRQHLSERSLFYLIAGLVLVFITIAIPVQLDGHWVTLLWIGEAALLFWIGRSKGVPAYEILAYPLMLMAFLSLSQDWGEAYYGSMPVDSENMITPIFNINFLSSVIFTLGFGFIYYVNANKKYAIPKLANLLTDIIRFAIPSILLFAIFFAIRFEIAFYWDQLFALSEIQIKVADGDYYNYISNQQLENFKAVWLINYSLLFMVILSFLNIAKIKSASFGLINLLLAGLVMFIFLTQGLYEFSELREAYLSQFQAEYFDIGQFNLVIRYISFVFVGGLMFSTYSLIKQEFMKRNFGMIFSLCLHISIIWILSSELIHWFDMSGSEESYKLGLSILWGVYSLFLIALGIWKKHKYLRIGAIILFAVTLIKLFFYDIAQLNTIAKTILFVSLGVLLLIISFLYNKYKHIIADEDKS